jgi:hypothetical protein
MKKSGWVAIFTLLFVKREWNLVKTRKYLPEYAFELLRLADADLASGHALVAAKVRLENACFHYQQAVGKSLKTHFGAQTCWVSGDT